MRKKGRNNLGIQILQIQERFAKIMCVGVGSYRREEVSAHKTRPDPLEELISL